MLIQDKSNELNVCDNCHPPVWQATLTFQMVFFLFLSIYYEISVRYSFPIRCILLFNKMSNTAVLHLRTYKKTPDKMRYVIKTPGGTVEYDVPIMKVQEYSLDDIFSKSIQNCPCFCFY